MMSDGKRLRLKCAWKQTHDLKIILSQYEEKREGEAKT